MVLQNLENRHLAEWRFSLFTLIVTVYPKIWNVNVIGIKSPPLRRWCKPPIRYGNALPGSDWTIDIVPVWSKIVKQNFDFMQTATILRGGFAVPIEKPGDFCYTESKYFSAEKRLTIKSQDPKVEILQIGRRPWRAAYKCCFRSSEGEEGNTNPDPENPLFSSVAFVCFCLSRVRCAGLAGCSLSSGSKGNQLDCRYGFPDFSIA